MPSDTKMSHDDGGNGDDKDESRRDEHDLLDLGILVWGRFSKFCAFRIGADRGEEREKIKLTACTQMTTN